MRVHFQDVKSATLSCEQLLDLGYSLSQFCLEVPRGAEELGPSEEHRSGLAKVRALFGLDNKRDEERGELLMADQLDGLQKDVVLTMSVQTLPREAWQILLQHGGTIEPRNRSAPVEGS